MSNTTNNRWFTVIVLLLLTANLVTLALLWAHKNPERGFLNPPPPTPQPGGQVFQFITNELKLDSSQQEVYKKLRDEHQLQVRPLQDSIGKAKDSFFDLLKLENVTDSMVENYSSRIGNMEQQRDVFTFRHFQKLRTICNKEQKIKFDSIIQQALKQMGPPRGPRPPAIARAYEDAEQRNDRPLPKPGLRPDGKRPPPLPNGEMMPASNRPPPPPGMRPGEGGPPLPNGEMRPPPPGYGPPPPGMRPRPPGKRPGEPPPQKDSI
jgi:Spy/CpxP family protein refolding chaperone